MVAWPIGTIFMMVIISAINGLSVAGMAVGCTIALPALLSRGYDKIMVTGVIQAGSTLGILIPPSVVLVLYGMIARQPVGNLWMAGVFPGLLMASLFILYVVDPLLAAAEPRPAAAEGGARRVHVRQKLALARAGVVPLVIFVTMTGLFLTGVTSLVESSAVGAVVVDPGRLVAGRADLDDHARHGQEDARHLLHVLLDHHRGAVLRRGVRRARRGQVDRGAVPRRDGTGALAGAGADAADLPRARHVPRRHGDAGHRRAAVHSARRCARLRSRLVRRALHDHLPDRLSDAAFRLQPLPDARHGAAGGHPAGHLPVGRTRSSGSCC